MTHPAGVTLCTVTFGKALSAIGSEAHISGSIKVDRPIIHAATGIAYYPVLDDVDSGDLGFVTTQVPHVDQAGFVDETGAAVTEWAYIFTGRIEFGTNRIYNITKPFQVRDGQTNVDLDLVPGGSITPGVTAPGAAVLSVAGETGTVTADDLVSALDFGFVQEGSAFADVAKHPGVDPTGTVECGTALQEALDAAAAFGARAYARGTFKTASTVTIAASADLSDATLNYSGTGTALRIGTATSGGHVDRIAVRAPKVIATAKTNLGWAQVAGSIGIELSNLASSFVEIPRVRNFETGLRVYGKGQGSVHNIINLGHLENNKVNELATADATGWSNQNVRVGGRYSHESAEGSNVAGTRHIEMATGLANPINGNQWLSPSTEATTAEYHAVFAGSFNIIENGRWEASGGARVRWAADSSAGNELRGGYSASQIAHTIVAGATKPRITTENYQRFIGAGGAAGVSAALGGIILENQTSSANPALAIMEAGAWPAGTVTGTGYAVALSSQLMGFKRASDTYNRLALDAVNGRYYFGTGAAAAAIYFGMVSTSGVKLEGGNFYMSPHNTYDIGLDASTLAPRDIFLGRDLRAGRVVKSGAVATGGRPTAAAAGAGGMIFDTTLNKPIWSTGSAWVDATGATV